MAIGRISFLTEICRIVAELAGSLCLWRSGTASPSCFGLAARVCLAARLSARIDCARRMSRALIIKRRSLLCSFALAPHRKTAGTRRQASTDSERRQTSDYTATRAWGSVLGWSAAWAVGSLNLISSIS